MYYSLTCDGGQTFAYLGNATNIMAVCNLANTAYMHSHIHGIADFNANVTYRRFWRNGNTAQINGNNNWTVNTTAIRCSNNDNFCFLFDYLRTSWNVKRETCCKEDERVKKRTNIGKLSSAYAANLPFTIANILFPNDIAIARQFSGDRISKHSLKSS